MVRPGTLGRRERLAGPPAPGARGGLVQGVRALTLSALLVMAGLGAANAGAETSSAFTPTKPVKSYQAIRAIDVVMQRHDFSCGAASLATLLNGYLGGHYTESQILDIVKTRYPAKAWTVVTKKRGLTLEDLAFAAKKLGFQAEGAQIKLCRSSRDQRTGDHP